MTPIAAIAAASCLAVGAGSDDIRVRELAPAFSAGAVLPLDTVVALAPAPGAQRRFEIVELRRIAQRLQLPEPEREVCVERRLARLGPERILTAMRAQAPAARIELLEYSLYPVPEGELEFPRATLRPGSAGAVWSGFIRYGRQRAPVWARVRISVALPRVIAVADLPAGRPIGAASLTVETRDEFPALESFPSAAEEVAGKIPRRTIRAGVAIRAAWLDPPKAVLRGETVQVEARQGGAILQFSGQAQASGSVGQTILILNMISNKRFPARIEGMGRVSAGGPR
jgi:flagella basal body P-ring formation protein FlgA